ncbi:LOB domain-containing protein 20 [Hibiscus syriacus]|uniref:LOB domain-containing protein 20 n=1 Tax=Hibiscus syriacus TaxID=106335 RepID=A0A6A3CBN0_HIBSY|nr:LOB domain-containing protein 20-like [Hibiscus syriacus]KAE8725211.1 LOB domain-containing protein 20 [Hibiscus syriacus]
MAEPHCHAMSETTRRKGPGKRANISVEAESVMVPEVAPAPAAPCGACKFLRRKCISGCIFAPHFGSDQGAAKFAAVHKVFGASNVSKLLLHIPVNRRHDAVVTISYEAQARLSDPVYGCVSTILSLQQQVASLQAELAMVQNQLINSRFAMANALQSSQQQQQQHNHHHQQHEQHMALLRPAYSNNSSASNNLINISNFVSNFELVADTSTTAPNSSQSMDHLQLSMPCHDDEDDEQDSRIPPIYANQIIHRT